jgi:hypothetical protein
MKHVLLLTAAIATLAACGDDAPSTPTTSDAATADAGADAATTPDPDAESDASADVSLPEDAATEADIATDADVVTSPTCVYVNPFSSATECKAYTGEGWTLERATEDCEAPFPGAQPGTFEPDAACGFASELGRCDVAGDDAYVLVFEGDDPGACGGTVTGCEVFGGGTFTPSEVCDGSGGGGGGGTPLPGVFLQPFTSCVEPLEGEPAGAGPDGTVCTNVAISGATEEGRSFTDYADCDVVFTQRPYYPVAPYGTTASDDPRLEDDAFMAEVEWARQQVASTGCVCCHAVAPAPQGPSLWYIDEPIWTDTVSDSGLALFAGWADSRSLGAYPASENNGFDRDAVGLPSTDVDRMRAFIEGELSRRGLTRDDAASIEPFGGPIYDQLVYTPEACTGRAGMDSEGVLTWSGIPARYVYVLEAGSDNPGVPPNLDLPEGTLWRLDVPPDAQPLESGVPYGEVPAGVTQRFPEAGAAVALESGETYYLYVLLDVGVPLTRCLFEAP